MKVALVLVIPGILATGCQKASVPPAPDKKSVEAVPITTTETPPSPVTGGAGDLVRVPAAPSAVPYYSPSIESPSAKFAFPPVNQWGLRETAADALARIGEQSVPALARALNSPQVGVRLNAARALARIGPDAKGAVPALITALTDQDTVVRQAAARALGQIGPDAKSAIPDLIQALGREK